MYVNSSEAKSFESFSGKCRRIFSKTDDLVNFYAEDFSQSLWRNTVFVGEKTANLQTKVEWIFFVDLRWNRFGAYAIGIYITIVWRMTWIGPDWIRFSKKDYVFPQTIAVTIFTSFCEVPGQHRFLVGTYTHNLYFVAGERHYFSRYLGLRDDYT